MVVPQDEETALLGYKMDTIWTLFTNLKENQILYNQEVYFLYKVGVDKVLYKMLNRFKDVLFKLYIFRIACIFLVHPCKSKLIYLGTARDLVLCVRSIYVQHSPCCAPLIVSYACIYICTIVFIRASPIHLFIRFFLFLSFFTVCMLSRWCSCILSKNDFIYSVRKECFYEIK